MDENSTKPFSGKLHQELTLDLNADVVEWSPVERGELTRCLAAGTYQLNEETGVREGKLYIYHLDGTIAQDSQLSLVCLAKHSLPGIFDMKWLNYEQPSHLALALADGSLQLFGINDDLLREIKDLSPISSCVVGEGGDMVLSVDSRMQRTPDAMLAYSKACGAVGIAAITPQGIRNDTSWDAHTLEAWYVCWDKSDPNVLYSGGDDGAFCAWDTRVPICIWKNSRSHGAGVCCISPNPVHSHIVCSGSYDDIVRMWDVRSAAKPIEMAHVGTGGGVWRLKWHPNNPECLLAACMYAGFAILNSGTLVESGDGGLQLVERYPYQPGLAYGADWCRQTGEDGTSVAATCSFYDRLLHLWTYMDPLTRSAGREGE